jgi:hypothetical protein
LLCKELRGGEEWQHFDASKLEFQWGQYKCSFSDLAMDLRSNFVEA